MRFKRELHVFVIVTILIIALRIMHTQKAPECNIFIFLPVLNKMFNQYRKFNQLIQFSG